MRSPKDCEPDIDGSRHRTVDLGIHLRGVKKKKEKIKEKVLEYAIKIDQNT